MTLLVALLIASSFVHDGVRAHLISAIHRLEPKQNAREGRNHRYLPFTLRRLPSLPPHPVSTDDQTALLRTLHTVRQSVLALARVTGAQGWLEPFYVRLQRWVEYVRPYRHLEGMAAVPALDTLPFPAPSLTRRCVAWAVDSVVVYLLTSSLRGTGLRGTVASMLWVSRDFWLCGWGAQSPGRWLAGQVVLSTEIVHHLNKECATNDAVPPVHPFDMATRWHDREISALVALNSLRLFLNTLGPLAVLAFLLTSVPPVLYGNGRSLWDRWTHVQVVDIEVLDAWTKTGKIVGHPNAKPLWESEVVESAVEVVDT